MTDSILVASPEQAIENILRYQAALEDAQRGAKLRDLMSRVHAWYAVRADDGQWLFAPSKFVGYVDNTAASYFVERSSRDGRKTEDVLQQWFHTIEPGTRQSDTLGQALRDFLRSHGHSGPRKGARISLLVEVFDHVANVPETSGRVAIDPSTCAGGRISGTHVSGCPTFCNSWRPVCPRTRFLPTIPISMKRISRRLWCGLRARLIIV